jgi:hypothetical protein
MKQASNRGRWWACGPLAAAVLYLLFPAATSAGQGGQDERAKPPTLEETRLALGKWIETQQIIVRERNEWQQGQSMLRGRLELVKSEVAALEEKIAQAQAKVEEADLKRDELLAQKGELEAAGVQLSGAVTGFEGELRRLLPSLPEPLVAKLQPLIQRIPQDPSGTRASVAERFQNVLGILNEINKANHEISVNYEVRTLAGGKPSEVRSLYVGLAQAYFVSSGGEAGIGRPGPEGWEWETSRGVAEDVLVALEILQGKHTPAFVPLPVKLR